MQVILVIPYNRLHLHSIKIINIQNISGKFASFYIFPFNIFYFCIFENLNFSPSRFPSLETLV